MLYINQYFEKQRLGIIDLSINHHNEYPKVNKIKEYILMLLRFCVFNIPKQILYYH